MKKLVITQLEVMMAEPPSPYISFSKEAYKKWITTKLQIAGFDLLKGFEEIKSKETGDLIFTQK